MRMKKVEVTRKEANPIHQIVSILMKMIKME